MKALRSLSPRPLIRLDRGGKEAGAFHRGARLVACSPLAGARRPTTNGDGDGLRRRSQQAVERLAKPVNDAFNGAADALSKGGLGATTTGINWAIM